MLQGLFRSAQHSYDNDRRERVRSKRNRSAIVAQSQRNRSAIAAQSFHNYRDVNFLVASFLYMVAGSLDRADELLKA
jgi:hypothetical protein